MFPRSFHQPSSSKPRSPATIGVVLRSSTTKEFVEGLLDVLPHFPGEPQLGVETEADKLSRCSLSGIGDRGVNCLMGFGGVFTLAITTICLRAIGGGGATAAADVNEPLLRGGHPCRRDTDCFSGHCYNTPGIRGVCAPDAASNGTIADGGTCQIDSNCFSNHCFERTCVAGTNEPGFVAGGGFCAEDRQCYSGNCYGGRCTADGAELGRVAGGGYCRFDEQCFSGVCRAGRCGADSRIRVVVPSGGHCSAIINWCWSRMCYNGRCTATGELGKVADGGRCSYYYHCGNDSVCRDDFCLHTSAPMRRPSSTGGEKNRNRNPGEKCTSTFQCASAFCVRGYCAPPSPVNRTLIADGGQCDVNDQCHSGQCDGKICTTSYADHRFVYTAAGGAACSDQRQCHSGACVERICSSDAPSPLHDSPSSAVQRVGGLVPGGGLCLQDTHCYSNYCRDSLCAPDGARFGTVADGGPCVTNRQCFSSYCADRKCAAAASAPDGARLAAGSRCPSAAEEEASCVDSCKCVDGFCVRPVSPVSNPTESPTQSPPFVELHSVPLGGVCWRHAQCRIGWCLYRQCTAAWFVVEKWKASTSSGAAVVTYRSSMQSSWPVVILIYTLLTSYSLRDYAI